MIYLDNAATTPLTPSVIDAMTVRQKYWEECGELLKNAA